MYKLIATDLDGTLLDQNSAIHKDNFDAIKQALEKGVKIVLCSGRAYTSIDRFEQELGIKFENQFGIGFNGALICNSLTHEPILDLRLENKIVLEILELAKEFDVMPIIYEPTKIYLSKSIEKMAEYTKQSGLEIEMIEDLTTVSINACKVIMHAKPEILSKLEQKVLDLKSDKFVAFYTHKEFYEFGNFKANKGDALKHLADHLNIEMKDVIAIGDNFNDIPMIKLAGVGVAVANAEQPVKDVANFITKNKNTDGVLKEVIEKYIL